MFMVKGQITPKSKKKKKQKTKKKTMSIFGHMTDVFHLKIFLMLHRRQMASECKY